MKRFLVLATLALAGCASHPDIYDKPGGTQAQFNQDSAYCKLVAMSMPQQQAAQLPPNYTATTSYNGTYMGTNNFGTANGMAQTNIQAQPNPGQAFANLAAAIGNIARQRAALRYCMASKGYTLRQ